MNKQLLSAIFFITVGGLSAALVIFTLVVLSPRGQQFLERRDDRSSFLDNEGDLSESISEEVPEITAAPTTPGVILKKYTVADAEDRLAVCNDGTPATYYFTPGTEENADKWVIYLKGGGSCNNEEECLDREANDDPGLTSSKNYPNGLKETGILSANADINPDFNTWNRVHVRYCSSDIWIGDAESMVGGELWQFRGKNIVKAVIEDLQNDEIIKTKTLADATELLFVGSSAGGAGVTQNLDAVAAMLPDVQVRGVADSSGQISFEPYDPAVKENFYNFDANFQNKQFDESCVASMTGAETNTRNCVILSTYATHIATPVYHYIDQYDRNRLGKQLTYPLNGDEKEWAKNYAEALIAFLPSIDGYYVPSKTWHTALTNERFKEESIDGVSFQEALHNWYFNDGQYNYIAD